MLRNRRLQAEGGGIGAGAMGGMEKWTVNCITWQGFKRQPHRRFNQRGTETALHAGETASSAKSIAES